MLSRKLLFVITDGGRARLVERSTASGDFVTLETLDHTERLAEARRERRGAKVGRSPVSFFPQRRSAGGDDGLAAAKSAFMAVVAKRATEAVKRDRLEGVVLAAPRRLIGALRHEMDGRAPIVSELAKDLTKTPDHDLHDWFDNTAVFRGGRRPF